MQPEILNKTLAILTLLSHIGIGIFLLGWIFTRFFKAKIPFFKTFFSWVQKNSVILAFTVVTFSTFLSLFYSEVIHLPPCSMCWYQRIFMFSQVFILGMAEYNKDKGVADYSLLLSLVGGGVAIYHIMLQSGIELYAPCSVNAVVSCSEQYFNYFGYITIPVMSLTAFVMVVILMLALKEKKVGLFHNP